jgi:hypothetical protein
MEDNNLTILSESDTSVDLSFETLDLDDNMIDFYGYTLQYTDFGALPYNNSGEVMYPSENHTYTITLQHNETGVINVTIEGLKPTSTYIIRVFPFRQDVAHEMIERGVASPQILAYTAPAPVEPTSGASNATIAGSVVGCLLGAGLIGAAAVFVKFYKLKHHKAKVMEQKYVTEDDANKQATSQSKEPSPGDNME